MSSLDEANRFVNCVMNRYKSDTVMRLAAAFLIVFIPLIAYVLGIIYKGGTDSLEVQYLVNTALFLMFYILSISMFLIYRRLVDHSRRDILWRDSLIGYCRECGCYTGGLEDIDDKIKRRERSFSEGVAILLILLMFLCTMIFGGFPRIFGIDVTDGMNIIYLFIISVSVCVFMFLFVFIYVLRFPYYHEIRQIEFTQEFSRLMALKGSQIGVMRQVVNHRAIVLACLLVFITAGLYLIVMLYRAYRGANDHVQNQWSYETRVMAFIISREGGVGVAPGSEVKR